MTINIIYDQATQILQIPFAGIAGPRDLEEIRKMLEVGTWYDQADAIKEMIETTKAVVPVPPWSGKPPHLT